MVYILFVSTEKDWATYETPLRLELDATGLSYVLAREIPNHLVHYIIYAPPSSIQDFSVFKNLKAVLSLWAGVDHILKNNTLSVPLARMVNEDLTQGMKEWVLAHVMRYHLGLDTHILGQDGVWKDWLISPLASERSICILGLGVLGTACAQALADIGFKVRGWSKTPKAIAAIECYHGIEQLETCLESANIIVLLLPKTSATNDIINRKTIKYLADQAIIINAARASLIDEKALVEALDQGKLAHATLDVFHKEPLDINHLFWRHPQITVTPHLASKTSPKTAAQTICKNIIRSENGQSLLYQVNKVEGY